MKQALSAAVSAFFAVSVGLGPALAEEEITAAFPDFSGEGGVAVRTNGDAKIEDGVLQLTRPAENLVGTAFLSEAVSLPSGRSFSAYFTFRMKKPSCGFGGGGDGLAFVLQTDRGAAGSRGGGLGYAGIQPSLVVEFDTHQNEEHKDPDGNHVGISLYGDPDSVATAKAPMRMVDGAVLHAWVDHDGGSDTLEVRLSSSAVRPAEPLLSYKIDLDAIFEDDVFVGFTAATGSCTEHHDILSLFFNGERVEGGLDTGSESFVTAH